MAFPTTGILDNFAYANGELDVVSSGAWANQLGFKFNVSGGVCFPVVGTATIEMWTALSITNAEVYFQIPTLPASGESVSCAWMDGSGNGYVLNYQHGAPGFLRFSRTAGYVGTTLGADVSITLSVSDQLGLQVTAGVQIEAFTATGGVWTSRGTRSDSTYSTARRIGITATGTTVGVDNFGGGTPVAGGSPVGPLLQGKLVGGGILQGRLVR